MTLLDRNKIFFVLFLGVLSVSVNAQEMENEFQPRTSVNVSSNISNRLNISIKPEVRYDEMFALKKYMLEGSTRYRLFNSISLGAGYRLYVNAKETTGSQYYNRYSLSAKYKVSFSRFDPFVKISYVSFTNTQSSSELLRHKAAVNYRLLNSRIDPYAGLEAFQQVNGHSALIKMRYFVGADYQLGKNNYLEAGYKLDAFQQELKNRHILSLGYKIKI